MRADIRNILRKMEAVGRPPVLANPVSTTPGALDDQDVFGKGHLTLGDVLDLKRILTKLDQPVTRAHYDTVYLAYDARFISREDWQTLEMELGKPRTFPEPTLPDRELTAKEKARALHIIENSLREFGLVDSPTSVYVSIKTLTGNGTTQEDVQVPDSHVGRRLRAILDELQCLRNEIIPNEAKEPYKYGGGFAIKSEWRKNRFRECRACGSLCEVYSHNW